MDIFFRDPNEIPLPPEEVRIVRFEAEPWSDGRRVHIYLEVSPFQKRPNGGIAITNAMGDELASISIIETMDSKMEFTMHMRGAELVGPFTVSVYISYPEEPPETTTEQDNLPEMRPQRIVDQTTTSFNLD
jgi:hypothetical protein